MSYAKVGLDDLSVPAQIQTGVRLISGITNNPALPTPQPTPAEMQAVTDALAGAYNEALAARLVAKTKTQALQVKVDEFAGAVSLLASYVNSASRGDAAIIESAGFSVRATPAPIGPLPAPTDLQAEPGEHKGHAELRWDPVYGAKSFLIQRAEGAPELVWGFLASVTNSRAEVNSMVSGKTYWHRVAAVGAAGQGPWSDPVPMLAP